MNQPHSLLIWENYFNISSNYKFGQSNTSTLKQNFFGGSNTSYVQSLTNIATDKIKNFNFESVQYQLCKKYDHIVAWCYFHYTQFKNHGLSGSYASSSAKGPITQANFALTSNVPDLASLDTITSYSQILSSVQPQASLTTAFHSYMHPYACYMDTIATHHLIFDLHIFSSLFR